jgi:DNA-binding transcriptional LysR family regulator
MDAMDLHRLDVFCKVVELKSFTKAAEAVFLSQPTISEHIRSLEESVGERLIDRLGREVLPTEAGKLLYSYARKILRLRDEAVQALDNYSGRLAGHLYIGASTIPGTYILPKYIGAFKKIHGETEITLNISNSRKVTENVLHGVTEFGLIGASWNEPTLTWTEFFSDELVLVVYPEHPFAKLAAVKPQQLEGEPMIFRERDSGTRRVTNEILEKHLDLSQLRIVAEMGSTEAVRQSIKAQIGISILSRLAVEDDLQHGTLKVVPLQGMRLTRPLFMVNRKNRPFSPICAAFVDFLNQGVNGNHG